MNRLKASLRFLFCLSVLSLNSSAQGYKEHYSPLRKYSPDEAIKKNIAESYKAEIKTLEPKNKKIKKSISESINKLYRNFKVLDSLSLLMHSDTLTLYLNSISKNIISRNPTLKDKEFKIFTYRSLEPNASSRGNGILFINLDIISKLNSESELAFILCHEMAHDLQRHVMNGIIKRSELFYDKKYQQELKRAQSLDYNRTKTIEAVFTKYLMKNTEHSRENELEADSIGLILFLKAGYLPSDAVAAISRLDSIDKPLYSDSLNLRSYFEFNNFKFNEEWLNPDGDNSTWDSKIDYTIPDSLKTHPDCKIRAEKLEKAILQQVSSDTGFAVKGNDYSYFRTLSLFETIELALNEEYYSWALYNCLELMNKHPDNAYLKCVVSNCLYEIYSAQAQHRFSRVVNFPDKNFPRSYNNLLVFLHNINGSSLWNICINYYKENISSIKNNEYASYLGILINGDKAPKEELEIVVKAFGAEYKDSYYCGLLNEKLNSKPNKKKK